MSTQTNKLGLFKYDPIVDKEELFDIQEALNDNWDKIDNSIKNADWNQNDSTQPDYVKNRPGGYYEDTYSTVFEEATVNFTFSESANRYEAELGEELCLKVAGEEFLKVTFDGVEYKIELDSLKFEPDETTPFGLQMLVTDPVDFLIYTTIEGDTHTVEISIVEKSPVPIDAKFLPDTVATKADIEAAIGAAIGGSY